MRRSGVRTVRRGCQAGYATIYSGVEDSVTESQQESLQNLAAKRRSPICLRLLNKPRRFVQNFANWRRLAILRISQLSYCQSLTFGAGIALPVYNGDRK